MMDTNVVLEVAGIYELHVYTKVIFLYHEFHDVLM